MTTVPSLSASAESALDHGFSTLNRAAVDLTSAGDVPTAPGDEVAQMTPDDPLIAGVRDLSMGKLEVEIGARLMHLYKQTTGTLLDILG